MDSQACLKMHELRAAAPCAGLTLCHWFAQLCKLLASEYAFGLPHVLRLVSKDGEHTQSRQQHTQQLAAMPSAPGFTACMSILKTM
jgi:hypothetical protein